MEKGKKEGLQCSHDHNKKINNKILIEYLFLDLETCDRCIGTERVLDEVIFTITPALQLAGYQVEYKKIEIETDEMAFHYKFFSSPTIKVNGFDICSSVKENNCDCCSEISGTDVDCRVFIYNRKTYEVPPKEMLANKILSSVFKGNVDGYVGEYNLPENLKAFFRGKGSKGCSCGENCC
ncbi:MAG: DUF2703 domain-containing protein [Spirochaetota bacterium]|nr:DUF2703 domain-containing protein [Spirochaetota bacterium]